MKQRLLSCGAPYSTWERERKRARIWMSIHWSFSQSTVSTVLKFCFNSHHTFLRSEILEGKVGSTTWAKFREVFVSAKTAFKFFFWDQNRSKIWPSKNCIAFSLGIHAQKNDFSRQKIAYESVPDMKCAAVLPKNNQQLVAIESMNKDRWSYRDGIVLSARPKQVINIWAPKWKQKLRTEKQ